MESGNKQVPRLIRLPTLSGIKEKLNKEMIFTLQILESEFDLPCSVPTIYLDCASFG